MINVCPNCHAVTRGKSGWRVINKYNTAKLCVICNHGMLTYKDGNVDDEWIDGQMEMHREWLKEHRSA